MNRVTAISLQARGAALLSSYLERWWCPWAVALASLAANCLTFQGAQTASATLRPCLEIIDTLCAYGTLFSLFGIVLAAFRNLICGHWRTLAGNLLPVAVAIVALAPSCTSWCLVLATAVPVLLPGRDGRDDVRDLLRADVILVLLLCATLAYLIFWEEFRHQKLQTTGDARRELLLQLKEGDGLEERDLRIDGITETADSYEITITRANSRNGPEVYELSKRSGRVTSHL